MEAVIPEKLKIGTRGSLLALAQTDLFIEAVHRVYPGLVCEKVIVRTAGDKILDRPLAAFGGKGVFVTEFEEAIRRGRIDCAVHSAKDMPTELAEGLSIVCVLPREDVRDVLVVRRGTDIRALPQAVIGTGSLRRQVQVADCYPNAVFAPLRGNVPTRMEKLRAGEYDGIVLAAAGLKRLGLAAEADIDCIYLDEKIVIPAGGQAVIAVEGRADGTQSFLGRLTDVRAAAELETERLILKKLNAGCHEAVGVYARLCGAAGEAQPKTERALCIRAMREKDGVMRRRELCGAAGERYALAEQMAELLRAEAE